MSQKKSRRKFLKDGVTAGLGLVLAPLSRLQAVQSFDILIRGANIVDGTGGPIWRADVGLAGDTIAALGSIDPQQARRVLEASNLFVSPGFIDIHSHSDESIVGYPTADSRVHQGITTEVTGNCGYSAAPMEGTAAKRRQSELSKDYGIHATWTGVDSYFQTLEKTRISTNQALLLGQGVVRENIVGMESRPLTSDELKAVLRAIEAGMDQGAFGFSTGLEYAPGRFTPTEEIIAMARLVARRGGLYASHIRNEGTTLLEAINEAIRIGKQAGVRVEISHLKAAGRVNWGKQQAALHLIESARRVGVAVLADAYPYSAYSTGLTLFMPAWALDGGWTAAAKRLNNPSKRSRIREELSDRIRQDPGDFDLIVIASVRTEQNRPLVGLSLSQIAEKWTVEPVDALLRLLVEEEGSVGFIGHGMSPGNVEMVLSHPLVMIGTDGYSLAPKGPAAKTKPHPRSYGACPRVLGHYVRKRKLFDLQTAIRKMTSIPADQVGLRDRGRIARGKKADLVVFDARTVKDEASFEDPQRYPTGIHYVLVNGEIVAEGGQHTGRRPGRVLRKN